MNRLSRPKGAYTPDPDAKGKMIFSFVVRSHKTENIPYGHTVLHLKGTDLSIWAYDFETLTVNGDKAIFKGTGVDKQKHAYSIQVTALDSWKPGDKEGADKIRIQIWDQETGDLIYDNQIGGGVSDAPTTKLDGGSIVIKNYE